MEEKKIQEDNLDKVENTPKKEENSLSLEKEEQPNQNLTSQAATAEENTQVEENLGEKEIFEEGSLVGKFKNVQSLVEAYANLEAEFTKKSQKLSEVTKEIVSMQENAKENSVPCYERSDWQQKVQEFLKEHPDAKEYVAEITEKILSDNDLENSSQPLKFAYSKVLASKFKPYEVLVQNEDFLQNYIFNNANIKANIINDYLKDLQNKRAVPVISAHTGSSFSLAPKAKPKNLDEAKTLAEAYFKI